MQELDELNCLVGDAAEQRLLEGWIGYSRKRYSTSDSSSQQASALCRGYPSGGRTHIRCVPYYTVYWLYQTVLYAKCMGLPRMNSGGERSAGPQKMDAFELRLTV